MRGAPHETSTPDARGARRQVAGSTMMVSAGLGVTGVGTIVMMALSARSLQPSEYAAFAVWWTVATLLGNGFGVFEAYLARLVAADRAHGRPVNRVVGLQLGRATVVMIGVTAILLALAPLLSLRLFERHTAAALLLPVFTTLTALQCIQRGSASGHRRFGTVTAQLSVDGLLRVLLTVSLVTTGADSPVTLAIACCASTGLSVLVGGWIGPRWLARPRLRGKEAAVRPLVYLLIGSVGPLLANSGSVPWLAATHTVDAYTLGAFAGAITLSRIPTQFVSAVFAPLLSHLTEAVEIRDAATFRQLRRTAEGLAVLLGVVYVIMFATLGPWVLGLYLGPSYQLSAAVLATLAAASSLMFVAVVQQASLGALNRWSRIAASWGAATGAFIIILALPGDTLARATLAPLAGVLTACIALAALSHRVVREIPGPVSSTARS